MAEDNGKKVRGWEAEKVGKKIIAISI